MSRKVDRRKPLSKSDRAYLEARGLRTDVYPGEVESEEETEETVQTVEVEDDYDDWKVSELKAELEERKLSSEGNKPALVARLREHDAANPE